MPELYELGHRCFGCKLNACHRLIFTNVMLGLSGAALY
jgi:hypothetical protein